MSINRIFAKELDQKMKNEKVILLDVRAEEKYQNYHIESANVESINIPKTKIFELDGNEERILEDLPKGTEIIVSCTTGNSATKCATILAERDYKVIVLDGGITAWKEYSSFNKRS